MPQNPLQVIATEAPNQASKQEEHTLSTRRQRLKLETVARYERIWLRDPKRFDPRGKALDEIRLKRTWDILHSLCDYSNKTALDLGCGAGTLAHQLSTAGATVTAVDVAKNALGMIEDHAITVKQDCLPQTSLPDNLYDLVVAAEIIGELDSRDHRLLFSELARLVKRDGYVLFSTDFDMGSSDHLPCLLSLIETEFTVVAERCSYHRLSLAIQRHLDRPAYYWKVSRDRSYRQEIFAQASRLQQLWLKLQTSFVIAPLWGLLAAAISPLRSFVVRSHRLARLLEKATHFVYGEQGAANVILLLRKRELFKGKEEGGKWKKR